MVDKFSALTLEYFLPKAIVGIAAGYLLRIIEHLIWAGGGEQRRQPIRESVGFCLMIIPESLLLGAVLGYALVVLTAWLTASNTVVNLGAYSLPAFAAFIANDLRDLARRISRF